MKYSEEEILHYAVIGKLLTSHLKAYYKSDGGFLIPAKCAKVFRDVIGKSHPDIFEDRQGPTFYRVVNEVMEQWKNEECCSN